MRDRDPAHAAEFDVRAKGNRRLNGAIQQALGRAVKGTPDAVGGNILNVGAFRIAARSLVFLVGDRDRVRRGRRLLPTIVRIWVDSAMLSSAWKTGAVCPATHAATARRAVCSAIDMPSPVNEGITAA